jgi:hypothetical protein
MKKLKQRVTLKRRRRNKMRHSHKMQRGGGIMDKAKIALENRKYEKMTANEIIMNLPDDTLPEYLNIIANKNLKDKIERDAKTILERTKNSWQPTNFKNWAKGDMELDNKIMEYFTAYNKIAQILTKKLVKILQNMKETDPRIDSIKTQLFEFFCKYITVIGKVLIATTKQKNKNILLKILYKHRVAGTLKDAITDTIHNIPEIGDITLNGGIQEYNIDTDKIKIGNPEQIITVLKAAIDKNDNYIASFNNGLTNAKNIITEIGQGECFDSAASVNVGGGKRNRKRKQRGGGKDEILGSLNKFVTDASQQIAAQAQAGVDDNPMDTQTTDLSANQSANPSANQSANQSANPSANLSANQSANPSANQNTVTRVVGTPVGVFATSPLQGSQSQNIGSLDDIIGRHDAANEKQTALLITQFERLTKLIEDRLQGSRPGTGEMGTGTNDVLFRSDSGSDSRSDSGSNEESGEESKDLSIKLGDLSKLTGDTYVQSVRYLKLLKAIIKKQPDKEGFDGVITAIDAALELLKALIDEDNGIIKIDATTKGNLETDNADIVEILFSLLGIGVTSATLGGKRKRKCKRSTIKRMKYRRDKKDKKKTQKKALDYK